MGSKNATTTATTAPNAGAMSEYQDLLSRAHGVAQTPYQAYTGDLVAPVNAQQTAGIGQLNTNANFASPYIQQAAGLANNASTPITAQDIQYYTDPYTQRVIQATQNQFNNQNAVQQSQVTGNAAAQGALGGDRVGVAKAQLSGEQQRAQDPVIAGLQSQGYGQALAAAQNQKQMQAQGAYSLGNLGVAGQNAALTGANAMIGAGSLQQQTQQQQLAALYQQYQMQQAFPYQQAQWEAGIGTGVGSQMGGTSTTTGPPPNPWSQIAGLGMAGLGGMGMLGWKPLAASGGRIEGFAEGGAPAMPYAGVGSWVPSNQITMGRGAPAPPGSGQPSLGVQKMISDANMMARSMKQGSGGPYPSQNEYNFMDADADRRAGVLPGDVAQGGFGQIYADGGLVNLPTDGRIDLPQGYQGGGMPTMAGFGGSMVPQGYADRGAVRSAAPGKDEQWVGFETNDPNTGEPISGKLDPLPPIYPSQNEYNFMDEDADLKAPRRLPAGFDGMPPEITGGNSKPIQRLPGEYTPGVGANPLAYADEGDGSGSPDGASRPQGGFGGPGLSQALMAAGFGMMASKSPYFGVAAGEGGLSGLNTYAAGQKQALAEKRADATMARQAEQSYIQNKSVEVRAKQLEQQADHWQQQIAEQTRLHDLQEKARERQFQQGRIPQGYRLKPDGGLEAIPEGPADPKTVKALTEAKRPSASLDPETLSDMAGQYLAGDKSVFQNLGRGAQGSENILALRQEVARQAREAGLKPDQIATKMADFAGRTAAMRTLGTRGANVEYAANTANRAIDLANEAIDKLPRTKFVPFNQLRQLVDTKTSSPEQAAAYAATNTLVNEYARVASGGSSQATEGMRQHAREMLNTAMNQESYKAVTGMMRREIQSAKAAYTETRKEFLADHGAKEAETQTTPTGPKVGDEKQFKQGVGVWNGTAWEPKVKP